MKKVGREVLFLATGQDNPRNGEGAMICRRDGSILLIYTAYYGDDWNDHCSANLSAYVSYDEGETWDGPHIAVKKDDQAQNIMSVSLLRMNNGDIGLFYIRKVMVNGEQVRITGNRRGMEWSTITAHGWFSYKLKVKPGQENVISVLAGSSTDTLKMKVTIGTREYIVDQPNAGKNTLTFRYTADAEEEYTRIRFDKISGNMPMMYTVKVQ